MTVAPLIAGPVIPGAVAPSAEPWQQGRPIAMICRHIEQVNAEVKSFVFAPAEPMLLHHDPGQYVTITAAIGDSSVSRCYTISSPATRPYTISITVKREPGGVMSTWLHDRFSVGDTVEISGPNGTFSPVVHPAHKYLFLAGGVGITPYLSVLRGIDDLAQDADVALIHHIRTPEHVFFNEELTALVSRGRRRSAYVVCDVASGQGWSGHTGRIHIDLITSLVPDALEREVFVCGPSAYMGAARKELEAAGLSADRIHKESFVLPVVREPVETPSSTNGFTLTLARSGVEVAVEPGVPLLKAAIAAGVRMPSSCGSGLCGTCKTVKLSGSVEMNHAGGIRPKEIAAGKILPCCSIPQEDVVIDA